MCKGERYNFRKGIEQRKGSSGSHCHLGEAEEVRD